MGELFTFGLARNGKLGHGGCVDELYRGWSMRMHWQRRRWLVPPPEVLTQQCGQRRGNSSPLGLEPSESWATKGKRLSLCRGWSRRWQGRR